jgi:hypothetical protein
MAKWNSMIDEIIFISVGDSAIMAISYENNWFLICCMQLVPRFRDSFHIISIVILAKIIAFHLNI